MLAVALAIAAGAVVMVSFWAGQYLADGAWLSKCTMRRGPMVLGKRSYWVVDRADPVACCHLLEVLHAEQDQRENAVKVDTVRRGAESP